MKNKTYTLNILLADLLTLVLLAMVLFRTFLPRIILPQADIPNLVLISLVVLVLERYLAPGAKRCWICIPVFSFLTFGLLPFAACMVGAVEALLLGVKGCAVFCALSVNDRGARAEADNDRLVESRKIKSADARACEFGNALAFAVVNGGLNRTASRTRHHNAVNLVK